MSPPAARHRYNANKSDNNTILTKKPPKKLIANDQKKEKARKSTKVVKPPATSSTTSAIVPSVDTAFKTFVSARLCSAIWAYISDCDETFNYWEPLHYIINGHGLQTWEYSPQFGLRSYTYLLLQGVPGWIYHKVFHPSPILIFYMIRCMLGFGCAIMERYMYKAICQEFGIHIGRLWLIFQLFNVGMFISSTALLPSSFSMYFSCAALAAWWQHNYSLAIFLVAISTFLGWPFAALMGVPIAIDLLLRKNEWKLFLTWSAISTVTIAIPMILIDSSYYGKTIFAPLNLVIYNVFTSHGPNIFGTAPVGYYIVNGFLNFNFLWALSIITPLLLIVDFMVVPAKAKSTLSYPHYLSLAPYYLWLIVFFIQPHKEERFLFPVFPLVPLCASISIDIYQRIFYRLKSMVVRVKSGSHYLDHSMFIPIFFMILTTLVSFSRVFSLYRNYHAPMDIMLELNQFKSSPQFRENRIYNVCIGKDWYRFPNSFFFPSDNFRLRFLKSEFRGMLPAYYADSENATKIIPPYFNDKNQADERTYFDYEKCHFLLDFDDGRYSALQPNYSKRTREWIVVKSLPFLIQERSSKLYRAFYIPYVTPKYIQFGDFYLLKRKNFKAS